MTGTDAPYDSVIRAASIVLAFVMGAFAGSFLNVVADRLPAGGSLVAPRSYCMACLQRIPIPDLAPILSYAWLRGRCRRCGVRIPIRVVAVEVVSGVLFALAYLKLGYGLAFDVDVQSGAPIDGDKTYGVVVGEGFHEIRNGSLQRRNGAAAALVLSGSQIAAIAAGDYGDRAVRRAAKHVFRRALELRLGGRRLTTRSLFGVRPRPGQDSKERP